MSTLTTEKTQPTKEFFVDMITRDIPLERAILDLIDNSIDAAQKNFKEEDFHLVNIEISLEKSSFSIVDNCGGISKEDALTEAFKFGKERDYEHQKYSIGRFGIGLKRALFKMGSKFIINSIHAKSDFSMDIDVIEWSKKDQWDFELVLNDQHHDKSEHGTSILVTNLYENISSEFSQGAVRTNLINEISKAHSLIIQKGVNIFVNGHLINRNEFKIKFSKDLQPEIISFNYPSNEDPQVSIKIIAGVDYGISDREKHKGGWYVFCNDRLVLDADQSTITGWDSETEDMRITKYHPDYAYFRGYVLINSDDAGLLPWTTTKTGLDADSSVYQAVYFEMRKIMYKINTFLKRRADEDKNYKKDLLDSNPITELIEEVTPSVDFTSIEAKDLDFSYTAPTPVQTTPSGGTITYWKTTEELELLKDYFEVTTNKDVGEKTFDYFLKMVKTD